MILDAVIFAAGLGTRLKPLTDICPKALIDVGGMTMLERAILRAKSAGVSDIIVNVHHHAAMIREWVSSHYPEIILSDESAKLLDTGGGLAKMIRYLKAPVTLVMNADIYSDLPLEPMITFHTQSDADVTLLVDDRNTSRYLLFDKGKRMQGWLNHSTGEIKPSTLSGIDSITRLAFGGFHILSGNALKLLEKYSANHDVFSIMDFYIENCNYLNILAYKPDIPYKWIDIGKPETLQQARNLYLSNDVI